MTEQRRKLLITVLKLGVGIGIVLLIASKLHVDDVVRLEGGGEARGRELSVEGRFLARGPDGGLLPEVALPSTDASYQTKDGKKRLVINGEALEVGSYEISGRYWLTRDGQRTEGELAKVALRDGIKNGDGWTEQVLDTSEGLATIFGRLSPPRYALALLLMLGMYMCGIIRWRILLESQGINVTLWQATRYTFIGFFFNNVVPGMTGGDVVKAVMIARANPGRGPDAVSTVIVDRVVGLLVLALMSAIVLLFNFSRYPTIATWLFLFLGAAAAGIGLFLSRRVRRALRIDVLMTKLPGADALKRLDQAFLLYRTRVRHLVWAVVLSAFSHGFNVVSIYLMGTDLGVDARGGLQGEPIVTYLATVPIILIVSSVPLLPGGWGLGEVAYAFFFRTVGIRNLALSVGLSVLTRASMLLWSLLGGVFFFLNRQEAREALDQGDAEVSPQPG